MQYENVIFPDSVSFHCLKCGVCCRDQPPDINFKEQQRIEAAGYTEFMQDLSDQKNRRIRRNKDGSCFFFTGKNTCKINTIKPLICILEPFIITEVDCRTNKIFLDLNPIAVINCKGIFTGENIATQKIAKAAQTIVKDISELVAEKTGLSVTDKKVASLTNKLLKN
jgi:Fe-S-cluster containining protein